MRRALAGCLVLLGGCAGSPGDPPSQIVVHAEPGARIDLGGATWEPAEAVARAALVTPTRLELTLAKDPPAAVTVRAPGACPRDVVASARHVRLAPRIETEDALGIGYGAEFVLRAQAGCEAAPIAWKQVGGEPIAFTVEEGGLAIRGRTPSFAALHPEPAPWGIVPISPRTQGEYVFEATSGDARARARVTAATRASGLPTLSVGQKVLLGGDGWLILEAPLESAAVLEPATGGLTELQPDVIGRWRLADRSGRELSLSAGRHDRLPLDCGRSECHVRATQAAADSPMTHVLRRDLEGELGPDLEIGCVLGCHATGELADGFAEVARALDVDLPERPRPGWWASAPAPVRRLGGVGCTACHGPSALPEPSARYEILRADTCAVCHDAPPRYGHVAAWRTSRMSRADRDERTASGACARCHTTGGFLDSIGVRPLAPGAPARPEPMGIACAACHAPHGPHAGHLLRSVELPASLGDAAVDAAAPSRICLRCHAPEAEGVPAAASAALWLGRGGKAADGAALVGPSPHAAVPGGCIGCHAATAPPTTLERGAGHAFQPDPARCERCHATSPATERPGPSGKIAERAAALLGKLTTRGLLATATPGDPPHASPMLEDKATPAERHALRNLLLVIEDPAAAMHNAPYARQLLDEAERALR